MISTVPPPAYNVKKEWLKEGCICLNIAADKNFEKDVRERVSRSKTSLRAHHSRCSGINLHCHCRESDYYDVTAQFVCERKSQNTIDCCLTHFCRLRLQSY